MSLMILDKVSINNFDTLLNISQTSFSEFLIIVSNLSINIKGSTNFSWLMFFAIFSEISLSSAIIFSAKVIDELDGLKNKSETKEKAQDAIREIRKHQKKRNISFNTSKVDNLPEDLNKKSPDNMILSVALQYQKRNPILLTNDKVLQIKAEMLEIPAKTITELTSLLSLSKRNRTNNRKKR